MKRFAIFLLLASFSFALSSTSFNLDMTLNSGGGTSSSTNFVLDANIGAPAVGDSSSTNFALSLTSIQAASAPAPTPEAETSAYTDPSSIASLPLDLSEFLSESIAPASIYFTVGSQTFSSSFTTSDSVDSVTVNAILTPETPNMKITAKVS